jgi:MFS family permease
MANNKIINPLKAKWQTPFHRARAVYEEYPRQFWILMLGTFIDRTGGAALFPFFTLYVTRKFGVGMTEVGAVFGIFAVSSFIGSTIGGALTDRWGRKSIILFGLVMSATTSILMGVIENLPLFIIITLLVGTLSDVAMPAQQALVADILPDKQRAQGFGIWRVVANLAVAIGPIIGGFLASKSYLLLFIADAFTSILTAIVLCFALKESRPIAQIKTAQESLVQTFRGYLQVVRDTAFFWFLLASILLGLVYMQMNTTLAVFLRDVHGVAEKNFAYILSLNATMVVLFQFSITRSITPYRPLMVMAAGALLYAVGFAIYGFVDWYGFFLLAMAIITLGEMLVSPVSQAIVARLAPEDMRGRYMAVYGFSWLVPFAIGPFLAGLIMDNFNPNWVWYLAGIIGLIAAGAYALLERQVGYSRFQAAERRLVILEQLENGKITAEEASYLLEKMNEGTWGRLMPAVDSFSTRHLRIRVSDTLSGVIKSDLRIPLGLVNIVLHGQGSFSSSLNTYDAKALKMLILKSTTGSGTQAMSAGSDQIEVTVE